MSRCTLAGPAALAAVALALALCAPAGADVAPPDAPEPYVVFTIGDSYAAGEGAPQVNGNYDSGGDPPLFGFTPEDWDSHFSNATQEGIDTERCHRSPLSPSGVATGYLKADFPDIQVDFESVACSGAAIIRGGVLDRDNPSTGNAAPPNSGGVLAPYVGADPVKDLHVATPVFEPQLDQIDDHLNHNGAGFKTLDALIVNIGGNDAGFASYVAACANVPTKSSPNDNCTTDTKLSTFRDARLALLPGRFDRLAGALQGARLDAADAQLSASHTPEAVVMSAVPAIARKTTTTFCNSEPSGDQTNGVTSAEAAFVENTVRAPLDQAMHDAADEHGWAFVDSHVDDFIGHAICQSDRWVNQNNDALRKQGDLDDTDFGFGLDIVLPDFSGGWVHPNARGYAQIGGALYRQLVKELALHVTPQLAPFLSVAHVADGVAVFVLSEGDPRLRRTGYYHAFRLFQVAADGTLSPVGGADGLQLLDYGRGGTTYPRTGRYLVMARACGPISRNATAGCGPAAQVRFSTFVPSTPIDVDADRSRPLLGRTGFQVRWRHASAFAAQDTTSSRVSVTKEDGGFAQTFTVDGRATAAQRSFDDVPAGTYDVSVQSCNDGVGCSSASAPAVVRIPVTKLPVLDPNEIRIANYTCTHTVVPWPLPARVLPGRNGTDGLITITDANAATVSSCLDDPPVGRPSVTPRRLVARPGRPRTLTVGWEHPRRWGELHTVTARLRSAGRVLANLDVDLNAGTISLGRGAKGHGRAARLAGPRRTLSAGPVRLLLSHATFRKPARLARAVRLNLRLVLGRSLAGHRVTVEMAATGDDGATQSFAEGGAIEVRRR